MPLGRALASLFGWGYDLLWSLTDLRYSQPRLFAAMIAGLAALLLAVPILTLTLIGADRSSVTQWKQPEWNGSDETHRPKYVAYGGLATSGAADEQLAGSAPMSVAEPHQFVHMLSDVLLDELDPSKLVHGSDGSEGGILPLDNGVVPSSGARFETAWELILPSAGIRAAVVQVGLTADGAMGSPDNPFVVGWFNRSAVPGEQGNALLGGHRDYQDRDGNIDIGVCWELDETRVGDQLIMFERSRDRYFVYDIVDKVTIRPDSEEAVKYLSQTRESVVTLITCSGDFDADTHSYAERIVVVGLLSAVATPEA